MSHNDPLLSIVSMSTNFGGAIPDAPSLANSSGCARCGVRPSIIALSLWHLLFADIHAPQCRANTTYIGRALHFHAQSEGGL